MAAGNSARAVLPAPVSSMPATPRFRRPAISRSAAASRTRASITGRLSHATRSSQASSGKSSAVAQAVARSLGLDGDSVESASRSGRMKCSYEGIMAPDLDRASRSDRAKPSPGPNPEKVRSGALTVRWW